MTTAGFPHSEISGSKHTYRSPKHIVVRHVLLQLLVPRHPPCALSNLTTCLFPNLIEIFDLILLSLSLLVKKSYLHYLVFKELFLFEKSFFRSLKTKQNSSISLIRTFLIHFLL